MTIAFSKADLIRLSLAIVPLMVLFLLIAHDGLKTTSDSKSYLFIASGLYETGHLRSTSGGPVLHWPPLFPIFLVPQMVWSAYTQVLQACLLVLFQIMSLEMARKFVQEQSFTFTLLIGLSTFTLMVAVFLWSELLFMVTLLGSLLFLDRYLKEHRTGTLMGFALCLAAAILTRNAGLFFMPGLLVFGLLHVPKAQKIPFFLALVLAASGGMVWNFYRIVMLEHTELARELVPYFDPWRNFILTFSEIAYAFIPRFIPPTLAGLSFFVIVMIGFRKLYQRSVLISYLSLSYLAFWIIVPAGTHDMARFLTPVFPILILVVIFAIRSLFSQQKSLKTIAGIYFVCFFIVRIIINTITWTAN